ncbi:hypothetical protein JB92DRAFT_2910312 [Gautieria morchelliformis]|nr:hypothetical protein JB92DRAFT_2910312 [Gautieria morchelliformis]
MLILHFSNIIHHHSLPVSPRSSCSSFPLFLCLLFHRSTSQRVGYVHGPFYMRVKYGIIRKLRAFSHWTTRGLRTCFSV